MSMILATARRSLVVSLPESASATIALSYLRRWQNGQNDPSGTLPIISSSKRQSHSDPFTSCERSRSRSAMSAAHASACSSILMLAGKLTSSSSASARSVSGVSLDASNLSAILYSACRVCLTFLGLVGRWGHGKPVRLLDRHIFQQRLYHDVLLGRGQPQCRALLSNVRLVNPHHRLPHAGVTRLRVSRTFFGVLDRYSNSSYRASPIFRLPKASRCFG